MNRLNRLWTELCARTDYESCSRPRAARFRLDTIQQLLKRLDNPHLAVPAIHVAGSKGKGTVSHFLERGLRAAGFRTGLYTSPHLSDWRERLRVNGEFASDDTLADAFAAVLEASAGDETFFDLLTAAAILVFQNSACSVMVLETGLGGRFDSTNVVEPMAAAVVSIELEHVDVLGADLPTIAGEKAGIFKPNATLWCGRNIPESALAVLQQQAEVCGGVLHQPVAGSRDLSASATTSELMHPQPHMRDNFALAVSLLATLPAPFAAAAESLRQLALQPGALDLPGRWERRELADGRTVILDVAHSANSLSSVLSAFRETFPNQRRGVILALRDDKDPQDLADSITERMGPHPIGERWWTAPAGDHPRSADPVKIAPCFGATALQGIALPAEPEVLLVTGSTYLVGAIRPQTKALSTP
jgi:dihydrofolate synthase/folylpolyglutamate synthase